MSYQQAQAAPPPVGATPDVARRLSRSIIVSIVAIIIAVILFIILIAILAKYSLKKDCAKDFKDCKKASGGKGGTPPA